MREVGSPIICDPAEAWPEFVGWVKSSSPTVG
jgi:hypothetical protein